MAGRTRTRSRGPRRLLERAVLALLVAVAAALAERRVRRLLAPDPETPDDPARTVEISRRG